MCRSMIFLFDIALRIDRTARSPSTVCRVTTHVPAIPPTGTNYTSGYIIKKSVQLLTGSWSERETGGRGGRIRLKIEKSYKKSLAFMCTSQ